MKQTKEDAARVTIRVHRNGGAIFTDRRGEK